MIYGFISQYYDIQKCTFISDQHKLDFMEELRFNMRLIADDIVGLTGYRSFDCDGFVGKIVLSLEPEKVKKSKYGADFIDIEKALSKVSSVEMEGFRKKCKGYIDSIKQGETSEESRFKSYLREMLPGLRNKDDSDDSIVPVIERYLNDDVLLGEFTEKGCGTITLYLKTICESGDPGEQLELTLIHEMFHAFHYYAARKRFKKGVWKYSLYQYDVVKEGLASFAEIVLGRRLHAAKERHDYLKKTRMENYPYASVNVLFPPDPNKNYYYDYYYKKKLTERFREVFETSLSSLGEAYNKMIIFDELNKLGVSYLPNHTI